MTTLTDAFCSRCGGAYYLNRTDGHCTPCGGNHHARCHDAPVTLATTGRIVNVRHGKYDRYIGRDADPERGYWGNPFVIGKDGTREEVLRKFAAWIVTKPSKMRRLHELVDGEPKLGCFCRPMDGFNGRLLCHGQILLGFALGVAPERID